MKRLGPESVPDPDHAVPSLLAWIFSAARNSFHSIDVSTSRTAVRGERVRRLGTLLACCESNNCLLEGSQPASCFTGRCPWLAMQTACSIDVTTCHVTTCHVTTCHVTTCHVTTRPTHNMPNAQHAQRTTFTRHNIHKAQHSQGTTFTRHNIHKAQHSQGTANSKLKSVDWNDLIFRSIIKSRLRREGNTLFRCDRWSCSVLRGRSDANA